MMEKISRRTHMMQELSWGHVVYDNTTCVHAYTVPTPNANVAPMKCTRNIVCTCQPIIVQSHNDQSQSSCAPVDQSQYRIITTNHHVHLSTNHSTSLLWLVRRCTWWLWLVVMTNHNDQSQSPCAPADQSECSHKEQLQPILTRNAINDDEHRISVVLQGLKWHWY